MWVTRNWIVNCFYKNSFNYLEWLDGIRVRIRVRRPDQTKILRLRRGGGWYRHIAMKVYKYFWSILPTREWEVNGDEKMAATTRRAAAKRRYTFCFLLSKAARRWWWRRKLLFNDKYGKFGELVWGCWFKQWWPPRPVSVLDKEELSADGEIHFLVCDTVNLSWDISWADGRYDKTYFLSAFHLLRPA